jgi:hypothetical protein
MKYIIKGAAETEFSAQNFALATNTATLYYALSSVTRCVSAVAIPEIRIGLKALIAPIFGVDIIQHAIVQRGIVNGR